MTRLYLDDAYRSEFDAEIVESAGGACVLSRTAFHPGGGGQPCDRGALLLGGERFEITAIREDDAGRIWHVIGRDAAPGAPVRGVVDWTFRHALMRHHALMHVVNTIALRDHGGLITGVQLGADRSRIDLRLAGFSRAQIPAFEQRVNEVIARDLAITSSVISEAEYRARPDLIRTLDVRPPVVGGVVRIVEIAGFDAQACGGTHVHSTAEIGAARVDRWDNKGKDNKRFYFTLSP